MQTLTLIQADRRRSNEREFIFIGAVPCNEDCIPAGYEYGGTLNKIKQKAKYML